MFNLKRFRIIITGILIAIFTFSFQIAQDKNADTIQTSSVPSSSKVIIVDAGHGTPDEGDCLLKFVVRKLQIAIN